MTVDEYVGKISESLRKFEITFEGDYETSKVIVVKEGFNEVDIVIEIQDDRTITTQFLSTETTEKEYVDEVMSIIINSLN